MIKSIIRAGVCSVALYGSQLMAFEGFDGGLRVGYQTHQIDEGAKALAYASSLRLHANYRQEAFISSVTLYGVAGFEDDGFEGIPFLDENHRSFLTVSEAYLGWKTDLYTVKIGRQYIETPFADTDDIGMVPNSFEALTASYRLSDEMLAETGYLNRWSGVDAPTRRSFSKLVDNGGVGYIGLQYDDNAELSWGGWYYRGNTIVNALYAEVTWQQTIQDAAYDLGLQAAYLDLKGNGISRVLGLSLSRTWSDTGIVSTFSFNRTFGVPADNLFGGGPYFTNVEHNTLTEAGTDGSVGVLSIESSLQSIGFKDANFALYLHRQLNEGVTGEYDLYFDYALQEDLSLHIVYSQVRWPSRFENFHILAEYNF